MNRILRIVLLFLVLGNPAMSQNGLPTASEIREMIAGQIKSFKVAGEAVFKVEDLVIGTGVDTIRIRVYYPDGGTNKRILFNIHGGAFVACDLDTHDNISRALGNGTQSVVVAIDYRKPPEHPFPASIEECEKVMSWIRKNARSINGNGDNIVLVGDSGAGILITAMAVKGKHQLGAKAICLINPATDLRNLVNPMYQLVAGWYLNGKNASDSLASPILATDFSYYPRTLIITSEEDELKPQGVALYNKLKAAGRPVEMLDLEKLDHLGGLWAGNHPLAKNALDRTLQFINSLHY